MKADTISLLVTMTAVSVAALFCMEPSEGWSHPPLSLLPRITIYNQPRPSSSTAFVRYNDHFRHKKWLVFSTPSLSSSPSPPTPLSSSSSSLPSTNLGSDDAAWKKEGEQIILNAAVEAGAKPEMVRVDWKSGRVVITIDGAAYIPAELDSDDDSDDKLIMDDMDDDDESDMDEEFFDEVLDDDESFAEDFEEDFNEEDFSEEHFKPLRDDETETDGGESLGVDVVAIARAINKAFDEKGEGSVGYNIAVHHSIEVTTPGATDELSGIMFEAYRGFDVILEFKDSKTGKTKKVEGKLVEKDDEWIRINEKGRMRKFSNDLVVSVRLPKAKTEKGVLSSKKASSKKPKKKRK